MLFFNKYLYVHQRCFPMHNACVLLRDFHSLEQEYISVSHSTVVSHKKCTDLSWKKRKKTWHLFGIWIHLHPRRHRAERSGIRLDIHIGFKSRDQISPLSKTPSSLNSRWHLHPTIAIPDQRDAATACHLDVIWIADCDVFNFHQVYCWNPPLAFFLLLPRRNWIEPPGRLTRPLHVMLWLLGIRLQMTASHMWECVLLWD